MRLHHPLIKALVTTCTSMPESNSTVVITKDWLLYHAEDHAEDLVEEGERKDPFFATMHTSGHQAILYKKMS